MKKITYSVSIPKPCEEKWDQMIPEDKGRHCLHCQKTVTDFSSMSDEEIIRILQKGSNLCGRFLPRQIAVPLSTQIYTGRHFRWRDAIMAVFLSLFSFKAMAMPHRKVVEPTEQLYIKTPMPRFEKTLKGPDTDTGKITITGQVFDSVTKQALVEAQIVLRHKGVNLYRTVTDEEGKFYFEIKKKDSLVLSCYYLGYVTKSLPISSNHNTYNNINLQAPMIVDSTGIVMTMGAVTVCEKPTLKTRIKWFFRRTFHSNHK